MKLSLPKLIEKLKTSKRKKKNAKADSHVISCERIRGPDRTGWPDDTYASLPPSLLLRANSLSSSSHFPTLFSSMVCASSLFHPVPSPSALPVRLQLHPQYIDAYFLTLSSPCVLSGLGSGSLCILSLSHSRRRIWSVELQGLILFWFWVYCSRTLAHLHNRTTQETNNRSLKHQNVLSA